MRRALLAICTAVVVALSVSSAATAATDDQQRVDELGLSVAVGFDGQTREAAWQPVTVGLEPARPIRGTLSLRSRSSSTTESLQVEVAAGSRKLYRLLAPPGLVSVTFAEEGGEPLSVRPPDPGPGNDYIVGLVGSGAPNLPPLRSEITGTSGTWVTVDPVWLEMSADAVGIVSTLVIPAAELDALAPQARSHLTAAVAAGTDLVVTGTAEDTAGLGLPWTSAERAWQAGLGPAGQWSSRAGVAGGVTAVPAGYGRVVTTTVEPGAPGAGRSGELWSSLTQPNHRDDGFSNEFKVTTAAHQFSRLLAETGSDVPALPGLGAFVAVYVLVVGPLNGLFLARKGRRELAWATVPLITVIFTGGAFLGATSARPPSGGAARLTYWTDGVATEFVAAGVRAPTPGTQSLTFAGPDWTVRPLVDGDRATAITRGDHTSVSMNLTALQLGGVAASRSVDAPAPLEVTAKAGAEGVDVTVRNTSGRALRDLVVRTATTTRAVAALPAGDTAEVTLTARTMQPGSAYRDPFEGLPLDANGSVTPPLSLRAVLNTEVADGRPGLVWVSGIDESATAIPVRSGDEQVRNRGSMVAVGVPIAPGRRLSPFELARDAFATGDQTRVGPAAVEGAGEVYLRYRLPAGANVNHLSNQLERGDQSGGRADITVWNPQRREWIEPAAAFAPSTRPQLVSPLGEVWVRATGDMFPFEYQGRTIAGGGE